MAEIKETKKGFIFNYIRVSTKVQNTERQLDSVECHREFIDKCSGKDRHRPELAAMLKFIKAGDHINVHSIDRLARSLKDLRDIVDEIIKKGCSIKFHTANLLFTGEKNNPVQDLMFNTLGAVAEFERALINERRAEGVEKARAKGVIFGRPIDEALHLKIIHELWQNGRSVRQVAADVGCSPTTVQNTRAKFSAILEFIFSVISVDAVDIEEITTAVAKDLKRSEDYIKVALCYLQETGSTKL